MAKLLLQIWSADPKRRPRFADLVPQLAAIRGAVSVTADGRLTVNSYEELVPLTGVVARGTDEIKQETDRITRLLAEFGVDDVLVGVAVVLKGAGAGDGGDRFDAGGNMHGGGDANDYAQFNAMPGIVAPASTDDYHQFNALPSAGAAVPTLATAATVAGSVVGQSNGYEYLAVGGSDVGKSNGYEYIDSASVVTATAGTAGQVVVNTAFAMASAQEEHSYTEVGALQDAAAVDDKPSPADLNGETRL